MPEIDSQAMLKPKLAETDFSFHWTRGEHSSDRPGPQKWWTLNLVQSHFVDPNWSVFSHFSDPWRIGIPNCLANNTKHIWGCIKTRYSGILFKWRKITLSFFFFTLVVFSGGGLPVDNKCEFSSFLWVRASSVESQQMSSFVFISFHFAFMSSHVPLLCIKDTGLRKLICSNRSGGYPPKHSRFLNIRMVIVCYRFCYRLAIVSEACAGCHLQASWTCTCISSLSFFFLLSFSGRQCIGSVKVQAKMKCRGYYTIWICQMGGFPCWTSRLSRSPANIDFHFGRSDVDQLPLKGIEAIHL